MSTADDFNHTARSAGADDDLWAGFDMAATPDTDDEPNAQVLSLAAARAGRQQPVAVPVPAPVQEQHRGHLRMAERFVGHHADGLRHVHNVGWHLWTGSHWQQDEKRADLEAAVQTVKAALAQLAELDKDERDELLKDIRKAEQASGLEGMVKIAGALPPISTSHKQLDADPHLFNTPTGTIDLRTGTIKPCDRDDLITKVAGATITGDVNDEWTTFVERILPDPDVRAFVQRLFGYSMLGKQTEHVMPIFTGTGANGKGTMRDAIAQAFGDYAIEVDPALLMESRNPRHGSFKMVLRGARLAFMSETEKGRRFAEAEMKRLVGGDPIQANYMHKNPITFDPSHTLVMLTNHLPKVSGDDPAVWRRILVVPFDVVIPEDQRDGELPERLKAAAPAVLSWVWTGWLDYQAQGLNPPEAVRARTLEYQLSSDVLGRFMEERVIINPHSSVRSRELFEAYKTWCRKASEVEAAEISEVMFAESMKGRGYDRKRNAAGKFYPGLTLAEEETGEDEKPRRRGDGWDD